MEKQEQTIEEKWSINEMVEECKGDGREHNLYYGREEEESLERTCTGGHVTV